MICRELLMFSRLLLWEIRTVSTSFYFQRVVKGPIILFRFLFYLFFFMHSSLNNSLLFSLYRVYYFSLSVFSFCLCISHAQEKPQLNESEKDELLRKLQKLEKKQKSEILRWGEYLLTFLSDISPSAVVIYCFAHWVMIGSCNLLASCRLRRKLGFGQSSYSAPGQSVYFHTAPSTRRPLN